MGTQVVKPSFIKFVIIAKIANITNTPKRSFIPSLRLVSVAVSSLFKSFESIPFAVCPLIIFFASIGYEINHVIAIIGNNIPAIKKISLNTFNATNRALNP